MQLIKHGDRILNLDYLVVAHYKPDGWMTLAKVQEPTLVLGFADPESLRVELHGAPAEQIWQVLAAQSIDAELPQMLGVAPPGKTTQGVIGLELLR